MNRNAILVTLSVLLLGLAAWSQETVPKAELTLDYSYVRYNPARDFAQSYSLNGGGGAVVFNLNRFFGIKVDIQGYGSTTHVFTVPAGRFPALPAGAVANVQGNLSTFLGGPQIGVRKGKIRPFVHLLFGGAHTNVYTNAFNSFRFASAAPSGTAFSMLFGGGIDIALGSSGKFAVRPVDVGYLLTRFNNTLTSNQNNFRYAAGVVFNLGSK
jgi:hypothetical protein